jgi:hypothetical protein
MVWCKEYEIKSFTICEICGAEGNSTNIGGWIGTLCSKHVAEYLKKMGR